MLKYVIHFHFPDNEFDKNSQGAGKYKYHNFNAKINGLQKIIKSNKFHFKDSNECNPYSMLNHLQSVRNTQRSDKLAKKFTKYLSKNPTSVES